MNAEGRNLEVAASTDSGLHGGCYGDKALYIADQAMQRGQHQLLLVERRSSHVLPSLPAIRRLQCNRPGTLLDVNTNFMQASHRSATQEMAHCDLVPSLYLSIVERGFRALMTLLLLTLLSLQGKSKLLHSGKHVSAKETVRQTLKFEQVRQSWDPFDIRLFLAMRAKPDLGFDCTPRLMRCWALHHVSLSRPWSACLIPVHINDNDASHRIGRPLRQSTAYKASP